jgi:hypothetical protein
VSQAAKDYDLMCRVGYGCGLDSIDESFCQLSRHYDAFFLIEEARDRLNELSSYITSLGTWEKTLREARGDLWCDEQELNND